MDTEQFIERVRSRPALYDLGSPAYKDAILKNNAWAEVIEGLANMPDG